MQPFSLHCCHKYRGKKTMKFIIRARTKNPPKCMNIKKNEKHTKLNHNDGSERCWKQANETKIKK